jgi:hypothetical protein
MSAAIFATLRTLGYASTSGSYAAVGAVTTQAYRAFRITNNTNGDMLFSFDGTNDQIFVPAGSFVLYDLDANAANVNNSDWFVLKIGSQLYAKRSGTAPTQGSIYFEGVHSVGV